MTLANEPTSLAYHCVVYCESIATYTGGGDIINRPVITQFDCVTHEREGLILSQFLIDVVFGVVTAELNALLLIGQRASPCTFDHLFIRLPSLYLNACLLLSSFV